MGSSTLASVELSSREEPASLEPSTAIGTLPLAKTSSSAMTEVGTIRSSEANVYSDRDLLALLRLERMAQQATQRDYEALRKQYQRYCCFLVFFSKCIFLCFLRSVELQSSVN